MTLSRSALQVQNRTANGQGNGQGYMLESVQSEFECYKVDRFLRDNGEYGTTEWFFEVHTATLPSRLWPVWFD